MRLRPRCLRYVVTASLFAVSSGAQDFERQLAPGADAVARVADKAGAKTIAVIDFVDLQGDVTELGRFLADELGTTLAMTERRFKIVDRANLKVLLEEHKLSISGLVNPANAKKLGQIAGVDAILLGTITPLSDNVQLSVKLIATDTAYVLGASRGTLARTKTIEELLGRGVGDDRPRGATPAPPPPRRPAGDGSARYTAQNEWVRVKLKSLGRDGGSLVAEFQVEILVVTGVHLRVSRDGWRLISGDGNVHTPNWPMVVGISEGSSYDENLVAHGTRSFRLTFDSQRDDHSEAFELNGKLWMKIDGAEKQLPINFVEIPATGNLSEEAPKPLRQRRP